MRPTLVVAMLALGWSVPVSAQTMPRSAWEATAPLSSVRISAEGP